MLGTACNLHCRYCLQQCQKIPALPAEINPEIYKVIEDCANRHEFDIVFYGGEPTVYFNKIKTIVKNIQKLNTKYPILIGMISNGKLINKEIVDFINDNGLSVTISYDGQNSSKTRLYDVIKENKENILQLNNLGFSGVLSAENYLFEWGKDIDKLREEYRKIHGEESFVYANVDYIFDTGIADKKLIENLDYDRIEKEFYELARAIVTNNTKIGETAFSWGQHIADSLLSTFDLDKKKLIDINIDKAPCGNGYSVINIDLAGNLYSCHNEFTPIGDLKSNEKDYLQKVEEKDNTCLFKKECEKCEALRICYGGCKLLNKETRESYCKIRKAIAKSFLAGVASTLKK